MIEPLLITSSLLFGKEIVNQTITSTTKNIYIGIDNLMSTDDESFKNLIEKLDITSKLNIIHKFIDELTSIDQTNFSKTVELSLETLSEILKKIETEIEIINKEIIDHKNKWFYKLRTQNYKTMIDNLVNHLDILDKRFNMLVRILQVS